MPGEMDYIPLPKIGADGNIKVQNKLPVQKPGDAKGKFTVISKLALLLGIISIILYSNTLKNGYAFDDIMIITKNHLVAKGLSGIPELLTTPHMYGYTHLNNDTYRPLSLVIFAAEYQFFGKDPMPGHVLNIILFAGCVILLFLFLDKLFERKRTVAAFLASLLFVFHPIHTEVVANIKSSDELLCFFFAFLCLNIFMKYVQSGKITQLLSGSLCFLLSLLSKETTITFLAVIPLIFFFYKNYNKKYSVNILIGTVLTAVIFLTIRFSVLNSYHANDFGAINFIDNPLANQDISILYRLATKILILGYYLKLLFVPYPLISDYSFNSIPIVNFSNLWVLVSLAAYIFLGALCILRFRKKHKDPIVLGIMFYLITIALFSNIFFLIGSALGERLLFFPSVGFCLLIALLIEKWAGNTEAGLANLKRPKLLVIIIPIILVFAGITMNRNADWLDSYTLFSTDVKKSPNDSRLNYSLGSELERIILPNEKDPVQQKKILEEAISYLNNHYLFIPISEKRILILAPPIFAIHNMILPNFTQNAHWYFNLTILMG
jgi:protein O-mannosyl-transferase